MTTPLSILFLLALSGTCLTHTTKQDTTDSTSLPEEDVIKLAKLKNHTPISDDEIKEFFDKKDCSSYKPDERIQCDISLYNAGLTTQLETINDIKQALIEWEKEIGTSDSFYFIGLDTVNWALAIGHAELILGTTYASLTMMIPRYHKKEYLHHYTKSNKPTIVYAYNEMVGNEVIDHWNTWTAIEGTENKNILYVADTKATSRNAKKEKDECKTFMELPKSLKDRKYVTVAINGPLCNKIPTTHRVLIGNYKKIENKGLHTTTVWVPTWECDPNTLECAGEMSDKEIEWVQHFLA